ncbi:MAG: N-acetylmuramoyl-L-alanine amidase [Candidatus Fermentithermobacillus carboniphilus]|uniref:N-acetylmuramoyl-L-alanine amidase n=1 Tax=Candidatus Fermentithermobacillus carboniphilus TaxID=3085328 RepID=A0AAT9LEU2_9FIRM|nr:MAG: N-acetylmuramoyl-L-alanine amidase [Candidatus Fermentithermobacillus carboniphilus]
MQHACRNWIRSTVLSGCATIALLLAFLLVPIRGHAAPILRQGSSGQAVLTLQERLKDLGYDPGPVDGIFGPWTDAAVRTFQRHNGLYVDGVVGPITWAALERATEVSRGKKPLSGKTIVIDPGHGGDEPGAISYWGDKEKDFTLPIGLQLKNQLESLGATVVMTRYADYTPGSDWWPPVDDLEARVSIANSRGADLFLSIHINSYPKDPGVSGVMGFCQNGSWESRVLAWSIAQGVAGTTGLGLIDVQPGPYYVLNHTYMPAALIEVGFMTNRNDVSLLRQSWFQEEVARGMARGVLDYFRR